MPDSRFLLVLLSLAVGLIASLTASGAAGAPPGEWGPVRDVSAGAPNVFDPDLAAAGGRTHAARVQHDGRRMRIMVAYERADGSWSTPRGVPGSANAGEVELGLDRDGDVVLAWTAGGVRGTRPGYLQLAVNEHGRAVAAWATIDDDMDGVYATSRVQTVVGTPPGAGAASGRCPPGGTKLRRPRWPLIGPVVPQSSGPSTAARPLES